MLIQLTRDTELVEYIQIVLVFNSILFINEHIVYKGEGKGKWDCENCSIFITANPYRVAMVKLPQVKRNCSVS